ncbi:VanZ family protein [Bacillus sp. ISL-40]|uniref:VanZ family protein n=1 Tax=unclassified Bacillus (in: firmicutes) TaxID=185979 RepID=UPI001BEC2888|nr:MULTISPECIES: VanZ family protein [unclassified Bacillus (in: firmicutes)]MBT2700758.1 VanZ family protein [Bacillus sp. ISL-40]MBT2743575.1 VanZ family protein [Bacillus sp. ISL-77]
MRGIFILLWAAAILILTCTADFSKLMASGEVRFEWVGHPNFSDLLFPLPLELSRDFLLQKCGHAFAFLILTLLLQTKFHSKAFILILAISFALLTEILQLYFTRDGRMFDIGFDLIGILFASGTRSLLTVHQSRQTGL